MGHKTRRLCRALPFGIPALGYLACLHERVSYPTTIPALDIPALTVSAILGNLPEKIMRMSREKVVTHYNMAVSQVRQALDDGFTELERELLASGNARSWLKALKAYTRRWVEENAERCASVDEIRNQRGWPKWTVSLNR